MIPDTHVILCNIYIYVYTYSSTYIIIIRGVEFGLVKPQTDFRSPGPSEEALGIYT